MAALVNHKSTVGQIYFIHAEVVDHIRRLNCCRHATLGHRAYIHRTDTPSGCVQDQKLGTSCGTYFLNKGQNRRTIVTGQSTLTKDDQRRFVFDVLRA